MKMETEQLEDHTDGAGIPSDQRDAVLGRTDQGLEQPAAGLGLSLVNTLFNQYGGTLQINDVDLGGVAIEVELSEEPPTGVSKP
jgi:K+-sensing histidine kinase KdpD